MSAGIKSLSQEMAVRASCGCVGDRRPRAGVERGRALLTLALMRFVVIGNWTAKEPGSCFYGNVLEQQTREQKNRRRDVNGSCSAGLSLEGFVILTGGTSSLP